MDQIWLSMSRKLRPQNRRFERTAWRSTDWCTWTIAAGIIQIIGHNVSHLRLQDYSTTLFLPELIWWIYSMTIRKKRKYLKNHRNMYSVWFWTLTINYYRQIHHYNDYTCDVTRSGLLKFSSLCRNNITLLRRYVDILRKLCRPFYSYLIRSSHQYSSIHSTTKLRNWLYRCSISIHQTVFTRLSRITWTKKPLRILQASSAYLEHLSTVGRVPYYYEIPFSYTEIRTHFRVKLVLLFQEAYGGGKDHLDLTLSTSI